MKLLPWSALLVLPASLAFADARSSNPQRAVELVRKLADESFDVREQAALELKKLGLAARDALTAGAKSDEAEVRRRCRELLPAVLEADRQARIAALLADKDGKQDHDLPGWQRYREVAGNDASARAFFAAMHKQDTGLLADLGKSPEKAGELANSACGQLFQKIFGNPSPGTSRELQPVELASILLVAGDARTDMALNARNLLANLFYPGPVRSAMRETGSTPFKKLALAWMERQTDDEDAAQQMFFVVHNLDFKEGLGVAVKVARDHRLKARGLGAALTTIGKLGGKEHRALVEPFLEDKTVVGNFALGRDRGVTEVRDVALAVLVRLTGQDYGAYGFAFASRHKHLELYANFLGFAKDEQRRAAFARWNEWAKITK